MRINTHCAMAVMLLTTIPLRTFALLCEATVSWGEKNNPNYYAINYDCAHYTMFNASRWCRAASDYDPCPIPVELNTLCNANTEVTTGNLTLSELFSDAAITISEDCKFSTLSM